MELTTGELYDRYAIEFRKCLYGAEDTLFKAIRSEVDANVGRAIELGVINAEIASLEWALREGKDLSLEEIGRRSLAIRRLNGQRVLLKNLISASHGEPQSPVLYGKLGVTADEWSKHFQSPRCE